MSTDLLRFPLWRADHLGKPIPDSIHANSVCLPHWQDNVDYEEQRPRVIERLEAGYPRFVFHPLTQQLFDACTARFAGPDEICHAYPSLESATRAAAFIRKHGEVPARTESWGSCGVHAVCFPRSATASGKKFWQHSGDGVSSRRAEAALAGTPVPAATTAKAEIRDRIATLTGAPADHIFTFPCGMSAIYHVSRALARRHPGRRTVQYGFPYVDTLKVQQDLGGGAMFYPRGDGSELPQLEALLAAEPISAIFGEFPSNPLLITPDLRALSDLARPHGTALVIDDTLGSYHNVDILAHVDVITTSLTKYFSGSGDVMGGAVILNPDSPLAPDLLPLLQSEWEDLLWDQDAELLAANSRDYSQRMDRINETAKALVAHIATHPSVADVYHPTRTTTETYEAYLRPGGGGSGLFSIIFHDEERRAPLFFDALEVCKGPNLGTVFSLACPYTVIAHYGELDFVRACGVSPWLVRVSVGLEPVEELIARFDRALAAAE